MQTQAHLLCLFRKLARLQNWIQASNIITFTRKDWEDINHDQLEQDHATLITCKRNNTGHQVRFENATAAVHIANESSPTNKDDGDRNTDESDDSHHHAGD